jgi:hypothetical protein
MREKANLKSLSDDELLRSLSELLKDSRRAEADLVARIAEVDVRRLYAREAAPSMYAYCTEVLHLSEAEAWLRIRVARASRKHPMLLPMLRDGRLHLSGIVVLVPHLTPDNRQGLLQRAVHKTKRQIEELVAEIAPREDARGLMRRLPTRQAPPSSAPGPQLCPDTVGGRSAPNRDARESGLCPDTVAPPLARPATVEPLAPARFKIQFTASAELRDKLERLQALTRSSVPDGDLAKVIDLAVTRELERLEAKRFAKTKAPRKGLAETDTTPTSRYLPAAVRRIVYERDGGRCTYRDKHGRRCTKRSDLEFHHHDKPFARNGDHAPENIRLMCRVHNALLAERDYGKEKMARYRRSRPPGDRVSESAEIYAVGRPGHPEPPRRPGRSKPGRHPLHTHLPALHAPAEFV